MEHGNLMVLVQPAELLIIDGAAIGTMLVANPLPHSSGLSRALSGSSSQAPSRKHFTSST